MKHAPVRHRLEYVAYRAAKGAILAGTHEAARRHGRHLGRLGHRVMAGRRRLALDNLEKALPELDAAARRRVARECFEHYGSTFVESVSAARFTPEEVERRFTVHGWEHLEAAEAAGRGVFLMSGHLGCWELATYLLGLRLGGLQMVARPVDNPWVDRDLAAIRERFGNRIIAKRGAGHRMLNVLRRRGRVAIVIDQRVHWREGILVPFLGRPAWTSPVVAYLSLRTGAPVVPLFCFPEGEGGYRLELSPAVVPRGEGEAGVEALTGEYMAVVGEEIRRRPELWLWMHRRWHGWDRS